MPTLSKKTSSKDLTRKQAIGKAFVVSSLGTLLRKTCKKPCECLKLWEAEQTRSQCILLSAICLGLDLIVRSLRSRITQASDQKPLLKQSRRMQRRKFQHCLPAKLYSKLRRILRKRRNLKNLLTLTNPSQLMTRPNSLANHNLQLYRSNLTMKERQDSNWKLSQKNFEKLAWRSKAKLPRASIDYINIIINLN